LVDLVYLPPALRGRDLGSRLMRMIDQEAVRRGGRSGALITISFQAPGFHARHGWRKFGRVPCDPPDTFRVFMSKTLSG
jgi:GNAT superfamily N-acetyltransferase